MWRNNLLFMVLLLLGGASVLAGLRQTVRLEEMVAGSIPAAPSDEEFTRALAAINQQFRDHWEDKGLESAAPADELVLARRLSLALVGNIPSLEELRAFEFFPQSQRMAWLLERHLADRRHSDYLAERLARAFVGTDQGPFLVFRRRRFVNWLSDQLYERRPYDALVRELLSGRGTWTNNPAVNFVTATVDDGQADPIRLAGRTSRAFLGMRIDCLQCHDDFLGNSQFGDPGNPQSGTQRDFHHLAAFFSEVQLSLAGVTDKQNETYRYQHLDSDEEEEVPPQWPFPVGDYVGEGTRRQQLASWVTHPDNKPFARATVNRMWALLLGRPLVEPIDDIPLRGPFPPALDVLATDFARHGYDLQRLIRLIVATEVFQLDSEADFEIGAEHEEHWAVFPLTRLRPEQVAGSLLQACTLKTMDDRAHFLLQLARIAQGNEFVQRFGDIGEDEFIDRGGTIPQRLLLMNGKVTHERTRDELLMNATTQIAQYARDHHRAIETAYLAVLSRRPHEEERLHFASRLEGLEGNQRQAAIEDLYWVLLNSSEFSWNH